ncbi:MAG: hypothetical protein LUH21_17640 [Clostridiales bacterium]|nr:hypothetical protein [Clostridiales bacterium]
MPDPMPEIKYVELQIKFMKRACLRDYDFDIETGERTVKETIKIGKPIKMGESIRIIFPLVESKDKEWVQAMGNDGTCGFIRANKINFKRFNEAIGNVKTLPPYRITLLEKARKEKFTDMCIDGLRQLDHECSYNTKTGVVETAISRCVCAQFYNPTIYELAKKEANEYPYEQELAAQSLKNNYDNEEVRYGNRICAEARCKYRKDFYKKALDKNDFPANNIPVESQLDDINVTIVCETSHLMSKTRDWMADQLDKRGYLKDVDRIFVEDFLEGQSQKIIDDYMASSSRDLPPILKSFCDYPTRTGFEKLLITAKEKNIKIIAIGSELSQTDTTSDDNERKVERAAKFNQRAKEIIQNNPPATGKSAIIYAGRAHVQMHFSNTSGNVIQGFCKMFNTDAIMVKENDIELLSRDSVKDRNLNDILIGEYIAKEIPEITEKPEKTEKQKKPKKTKKPKKPEITEITEKPEITEKAEKAEKPEIIEKPKKPEKPQSIRIEVSYEDFSKSGLSTKATKMSEPIAKKSEKSTEVSKQPK